MFAANWEERLSCDETDVINVNSEIFARFLFSRNFRENKILAILHNHSVVY